MKLCMVAAAMPPAVDGIGDYTARLSAELATSADVKILTGHGTEPHSIPNVDIEPVFCPTRPRSVWEIARHLRARQPDWLVLQFNQFSYGRWGLNPHLPLALRALQRRCPGIRLAVMFHEDFVPATSWKFAVMRLWQRWQFRALGQTADTVFFSIAPWVTRYAPWFPGKPVLHLPVGSNIPLVPLSRAEARARLNISDDVRVLGVFGSAHASRMLERVRGAADAARRAGHDVLLLYVGPQSQIVREAMDGIPTLAEGPLAREEVSRRFAAMDVYLAPFTDGVSTRRTSFMTGLQHAVPTVATQGPLTDELLKNAHGSAFVLADVDAQQEFDTQVLRLLGDSALRQSVGGEGRRLYESEFSWNRIGSRLLTSLSQCRECRPRSTSPTFSSDQCGPGIGGR